MALENVRLRCMKLMEVLTRYYIVVYVINLSLLISNNYYSSALYVYDMILACINCATLPFAYVALNLSDPERNSN